MAAHDFFISYTRPDERWAEWIAGVLEDAGHRVFIQAWDIRPGMNFVAAMQQGAIDAERTLCLLSPAYLQSKYCTAEWTAAFVQDASGERARVLPVRVVDFNPPGLFGPLVYIDLVGKDEDAARKALLEGIERGRAKRQGTFPGSTGKAVPKSGGSSAPFPGALPPIWTVPVPPNPHFQGRREELEALRRALVRTDDPGAPLQPLVVHGLGGVGKTQLVVQYAWQHQAQYDAVLWVEGDTPASLNANLAALSGILGLPESVATEEEVRRRAVLNWLRQNGRWLLVLDNVDTREAAEAALPLIQTLGMAGHVLITSRRSEWSLHVETRELDVLPEPDAVSFLLDRTRGIHRGGAAERTEDAIRVARELGYLPLALEQATAYVRRHKLLFSGYLEKLAKARAEVLAHETTGGTALGKGRMSVASTWRITETHLGDAARTLLRLIAFLAPEEVPRGLFSAAHPSFLNALEKMNAGAITRPSDIDAETLIANGLAELSEYSLIQLSPSQLSCHRLLISVQREFLEPQTRRAWLELALRLVAAAAPRTPSDVRTWSVWRPLRPHVAALIEHAEREDLFELTTYLMSQLATFLHGNALWTEAEPLMRGALAIGEKSHGNDHSAVAVLLNNLAQLLKATNRLDEAEPLMRRALAITETSRGNDHPTVATGLNNLALLLQDTNRLDEAEALMRRALAINEKGYGSNHPTVATHLNNLALVLKATSRFDEAEPLLRRALAIDETSYGNDHPEVATDLNNLAQLLQVTNRFDEAEPLMRRALAIDGASYGNDHPKVAIRLNNLAQLLLDTDRLAEAEPLMRRALNLLEASYASDHPHVVLARRNLETLVAQFQSGTPP